MKIEVVLDGERKEIELKSLKGREVDKFTREMLKLQKSEDMSEDFFEFQNKQKSLASQISGLSIEQLDDLCVDDRSKIYDYINSKVETSMGFGKLLSK
jgi:hypothetical protein